VAEVDLLAGGSAEMAHAAHLLALQTVMPWVQRPANSTRSATGSVARGLQRLFCAMPTILLDTASISLHIARHGG
jgi:hypothetical protein